MTGLASLYPHQERALTLLRQSLASGKRRPVLQSPTGSGKTVLAAAIVHGAMRKGNRLAFCVPAISLIDQTFDRFRANGIDPADMGVIQADHPWSRPGAPVQIASAQTLARRKLPEVDLVVVDECHIRHKVYDRWAAACPDLRWVGLSATPWARGMGRLYDDLLKPTSIRELIDAGYLSPFRVFAPSHPDLDGVRTVAGDYHEGELAGAMDKPDLVADIVSTWLTKARVANEHGSRGSTRRSDYLPTLCFAVNRAHARSLAERFSEADVSTAYVDANTSREERKAIGERLASGEVDVVVNIGTLTTGIDWDVRCLILARPTKSEALFVQIIGRALRTAPGKEFALILDHSDTHLRLGMVTDIDHDELDDGKVRPTAARKAGEKGLPLPKECAHCTGLIPAGVSHCLSCGQPRPMAVFDEGEGFLTEFRASKFSASSKVQTVKDVIAAMGKDRVYAQLQAIQIERGRSSGWTAHAYRDVFGVWPRNVDRYATEPPDPVLRSWVRSKDIAYAKRNGGGARHAA